MSEVLTIKPKRKYVRKTVVKKDDRIEAEVLGLSKDLEDLVIDNHFEPEKFYVYVYVKCADIGSLNYVQAFQKELEFHGVISQILIHDESERSERVELTNAFLHIGPVVNWKSMCLKTSLRVVYLGLFEHPLLSPREMYELVCKNKNVKNDFFEICF